MQILWLKICMFLVDGRKTGNMGMYAHPIIPSGTHHSHFAQDNLSTIECIESTLIAGHWYILILTAVNDWRILILILLTGNCSSWQSAVVAIFIVYVGSSVV